MRHLAVFLVLFAVGFAAHFFINSPSTQFGQTTSSSRLPAADCYQNPEDWVAYVARSADQYQASNMSSEDVYQTLQQCMPEIERQGVSECTDRLKNFARVSKYRGWGHQFDFELSDEAYESLSPQEAFEMPRQLEGGIPLDWRRYQGQTSGGEYQPVFVQGGKWSAISYQSRTVRNPSDTGDRSVNRLLFLQETDRFDRWVQFTLPTARFEGDNFYPYGKDPRAAEERNRTGESQSLIDFISVEKKNARGEVLEKPVLKFRQFWRRNGEIPRDPNGELIDRRKLGRGVDQCYSCHPSGMRQLSPKPGSFGAEQWGAFKYLNAKMESYGELDWGGAIHPTHYGPSVGKKVGCAVCHNENGSQLSMMKPPINWKHSAGHIEHKIVTDLTMPQTQFEPYAVIQGLVRVVDQLKPNVRMAVFQQIQNNDDVMDIIRALDGVGFFEKPGNSDVNLEDYFADTSVVPRSERVIERPYKLSQIQQWASELKQQRLGYRNKVLPLMNSDYRKQIAAWLKQECE